MTTAQGRRAGMARWPMAERSLLTTVLGLPPAAAVGLAAVLTVIGVLVDVLRVGTLGGIFITCYFAGCVLAVCWVRRRSLFGPMVTPPLLLAVTVPGVVLLVAAPRAGSGIAERLLVVGAPLVNSFPTMAVTTGAVLAIAAARVATQRIGPAEPRPAVAEPAPPGPGDEPALSRPSGSDAARGAGRTSTSPPPS